MKPTYKGFEAKKSSGFTELPPVGAYVGEIQAVHIIDFFGKEAIEVMIEITEGEYKNRFHEVWEEQKERFGDNVQYRGLFRLIPPADGDKEFVKTAFEGNLWCVEKDNPPYRWDWDENKLKGKKVGFSIRKYLYTGKTKDGNPIDRESVEIGRFELIDDVKAGRCKTMNPRDRRKNPEEAASTDGNEFTDVSKEVSVPW